MIKKTKFWNLWFYYLTQQSNKSSPILLHLIKRHRACFNKEDEDQQFLLTKPICQTYFNPSTWNSYRFLCYKYAVFFIPWKQKQNFYGLELRKLKIEIENNFENNRILAQENFVLSYLFTIFVHRVNDRQTILVLINV